MKTSLQLKMSQQLTMTPQLQQAIRLLQLSTLDLQQEIQSALDSNPLLEVEEEVLPEKPDLPSDNTDYDRNAQQEAAEAQTEESPELNWEERIPENLAVDSNWDDIYQHTPTSASAPGPDDDYNFENQTVTGDDLYDHLMWQLNLTPMSERDQIIARAILDSVEPSGLLSSTLEDIHSGLVDDLSHDGDPLEMDEMVAVLHRLQQFEPAGVCARTLSECLTIQLQQFPEGTPLVREAVQLVNEHTALLVSKDYQQIMRKMRIKEDQLRDTLLLIQQTNPRPGSVIASGDSEYVIPDVVVTKDQERQRWRVELNPEIAPRLRVNSDYASMIRRADNSADNTYIKDNLQEAKWFIKSLQSRNETLLKVATQIVEHQKGFLEFGEEAMKPLVLHDIAEAVEMHESTISRVTTQKYMHTPRGVFELKYFFSSHVSTNSGGECSSTAIRALIRKLVDAENTRKPLSDSKIANLLKDQGINVARRTIAKYREAMGIPPSNERKSLV
ncbi:RNA polymerase factor sigma-54 [Natronospirillum operosum]|uniref:RNA polymerase sigma-54 factor n=1 Tax=Natronospirillum operosum TaxID=2759953 RepID=A0A4Z0W9D2_9GAMM|nr:RNA polymerase factor sigma-54 [Natronospirillum operosum]TGG90757.1 RNA polymerase factor sigma-54 [Natronospirillum operosum]